MVWIIIGLALFYGAHALRIIAPGFRERRMAAMGEGPYKGLFSAIALAGILAIVWGWSQDRVDAPELYVPADWTRMFAVVVNLPALILIIAGAQGGTGRIRAILHHPMLIGVGMLAVAHLLANGDLFSLTVFGVTLAYVAADYMSVLSRNLPAPEFESARPDVVATVAGTVVWAVLLLGLHRLLFGMAPLV